MYIYIYMYVYRRVIGPPQSIEHRGPAYHYTVYILHYIDIYVTGTKKGLERG